MRRSKISISLYLKKGDSYIVSKDFDGNYFGHYFDKADKTDLEKILLDSNCEFSDEKSTLFITDFFHNLHFNRIEKFVNTMNEISDSYYETETIETRYHEMRDDDVTTSYYPKRVNKD